MIVCAECGEIIIDEVVDTENGPVHYGGCPSVMSNSMDIAKFEQRLTVPREQINLSNPQLDAIQRLAVASHNLDQEINAETILLMWPTDTAELRRSGPKPQKTQVENYLRTTAFIQDMATRGVRLDEMAQQLTSAQMALVQMVRNPEGRKLSVILKRAKVTQSQFDGWMKQPLFRKYITKTIGDSTNQALLLSEVPLSQKALDGDLNAIKFLMEWQNKYNPHKDNNAADAMEFVRVVLGAVQRVVGKAPNGAEMLAEIQKSIELEQTAMGIGKGA